MIQQYKAIIWLFNAFDSSDLPLYWMYSLRIDHWDKNFFDCQVVTQNTFPSNTHTRLSVRYYSQNSLSPRTSLGQPSSQLGPTSHYVLHPRVVIYFYIPHKRPKPGGHLHSFLLIPHPQHPFTGVVLNRTARILKSTVVTVRRRYSNPSTRY